MKKWMLFLGSLIMAAGCSSAPNRESIPDTADVQSEIQLLNQDLTEAQKAQIDIFAPKAWSQATYYRDKAQGRAADKKSASRVLDSVADSRGWLKEAKYIAREVQSTAPDLLEVRAQAVEARAPDFAKKEYDLAETSLRDVARDREVNRGRFEVSEKKRAELRDLYINARVVAMQNEYLGDARAKIHDAELENAKELVPNLFEQAVRSEKNAAAYIASNRFDITGIDQRVSRANADARHMTRLNKDAHNVTHSSAEATALAFEKYRMRNRSLAGQLDQQAFQEKYDEARTMFTADEAEVYKQGDQLLVRVKGIEFPVNRSALPVGSYALVSKVGNVIKMFGEPRVRIEGHTDSIGTEKINLPLAQQRAEAVKEYLIANAGLKAEAIEVEGLGYSKPLASNKNAAGRAQNRRVDVIVMPQVEPAQQMRQAQ